MQKITMYITKKPKNCWECPCFRFNDCDAPCGLDFEEEGYFLDEIDGGKCPLKTVAKLKKEIRKEFEEELHKKDTELNRYAEFFGMVDEDFYTIKKSDFEKIKQFMYAQNKQINQLKEEIEDLEFEKEYLQ